MDINNSNLNSLYTGFSAAFTGGFKGVAPLWSRVATRVPSTTSENEYGWLKDLPGFREWLGDRIVKSIEADGYKIKNRHFENTVGVNRDHIEDDNLGIYSPLFSELGRLAAVFPDELVWALLKDGFATECFDGQFFFDTDHPVLDADGEIQSVSNTGGGSGTPWFLLDTSRALKPLIFQERKTFNKLVRKDKDEDDNVFHRNEFIYGSDGRCNVGFGFWQMAYGSKQTFNAAAYGAARAAMGSFKGDHGRPLGIMPNLLVVPPSLESAARKVLNSEYAAGGETNEWKGTAELLVVPWLA
tara:strand:- start:33823 stop:34719 length:897 start_codon:yes stop_codon:yes gene_type:complete